MNKKCFVVCPIGDPESDIRKHSDRVLEYIIKPACQTHNLEIIRNDKILNSNEFNHDVLDNLDSCDLVIADISQNNPNVFLEVGYRLKTQLPLVLIYEYENGLNNPTDIYTTRAHPYSFDITKSNKFIEDLEQVIANELNKKKYIKIEATKSFGITSYYGIRPDGVKVFIKSVKEESDKK